MVKILLDIIQDGGRDEHNSLWLRTTGLDLVWKRQREFSHYDHVTPSNKGQGNKHVNLPESCVKFFHAEHCCFYYRLLPRRCWTDRCFCCQPGRGFMWVWSEAEGTYEHETNSVVQRGELSRQEPVTSLLLGFGFISRSKCHWKRDSSFPLAPWLFYDLLQVP